MKLSHKKKYQFSRELLEKDINKKAEDWAYKLDGCHPIPNKTLTKLNWAGYLLTHIEVSPGRFMVNKERDARIFEKEWCKEI